MEYQKHGLFIQLVLVYSWESLQGGSFWMTNQVSICSTNLPILPFKTNSDN